MTSPDGQSADILISAVQLAKRLAEPVGDAPLLVVDARSPARYRRGHIAGAINLPLGAVVTLEGSAQALLPPAPFAERAGAAGLTTSHEVVVYGEQGGKEAAYLYWALDHYGHPHIRLLDGGIEAWLRHGGVIDQTPVTAPAGTFTPNVSPERRADAQHIHAHLDDPELQLIDIRDLDEFVGEAGLPGRGGHIPGAIRFDWERTLNPDATYRQPAELRSQLTEAGVDPDKPIILYCHGGPRAAHTYVALKLVGARRISLYDRSWADWSSREELPAET